MIVTMTNKRKVEVANCTLFGEFGVWDVVGHNWKAITFKGRFYDTRSNRKYAEWCAANFKPDHAERHMNYLARYTS